MKKLLMLCMRLLSLRKIIGIFVVLISFYTFFAFFVDAAELVERSYPDPGYDEIVDYEKPVENAYVRSNPLELKDSVFATEKRVTIRDLIFRVFLIVGVLLGVLVLVKLFLSRGRFSKVGSVLDEFAQKVTGNYGSFSSNQELKLIQTLILTPGQNIYLVEIEGKKLLLGATHQGGVHFLTDLSNSKSQDILQSLKNATSMSQKQVEVSHQKNGNSGMQRPMPSAIQEAKDLNNVLKHVGMLAEDTPSETPFFQPETANQNQSLPFENGNGSLNGHDKNGEVEEQTNGSKLKVKQSLKRRTNFRQLLNISK